LGNCHLPIKQYISEFNSAFRAAQIRRWSDSKLLRNWTKVGFNPIVARDVSGFLKNESVDSKRKEYKREWKSMKINKIQVSQPVGDGIEIGT
jgi:hypothetical protein